MYEKLLKSSTPTFVPQSSNVFDVCQDLTEYEINSKRLASIPDIGNQIDR